MSIGEVARYNALRVSFARNLYHRAVPASLRNPFGMVRRRIIDRFTRWTTSPPLPPPELLENIQISPFVAEYLSVGKRSAASIGAVAETYLPAEQPLRVLDFGCGSARTLRHLTGRGWELHGCDVDREAIGWARETLRGAELRVNDPLPPLGWENCSFDFIYAISLFTHFSPEMQRLWARELARLLRPGGVLAVSTMGPSVLSSFPSHASAENQEKLAREGSFFVRVDGAFNESAAFHSLCAVIELFAPELELLAWSEHGLDGFQDLSVLKKRE
jgi:SAM-dependent methyltransferase